MKLKSIIFVLIALMTGAGLIQAAEYITVADTYVNGGNNAGVNYGSATTLPAKYVSNNTTYCRQAYFRFDISGAVLPVDTASFSVFHSSTSGADLDVYMVNEDEADQNFSESVLTKNNSSLKITTGDANQFDTTGCVLLGTLNPGTSTGLKTFTSQTLVDQVNSDTDGIFTIVLLSHSDAYVTFASKENTTDGYSAATLELVASGAPQIESSEVNVLSTSSVEMSADLTISTNNTAVELYWGTVDGGIDTSLWSNTNSWASPVSEGRLTNVTSIAVADQDKINYMRFRAVNGGGESWTDAKYFLPGLVSVSNIVSAIGEDVPSTDVFTIYRASTATNEELEVYYSLSGTAENGVNYETLSGTAILAQGDESVNVALDPIPSWLTVTNLTVGITITNSSLYVADSSTSTLNITNVAIPYSYPTNVWVGDGTSANASEPMNWSLEHVPTSDEIVLLGEFSSADMTWDYNGGANGVTNIVAEWTQAEDYTGTVTFPITYSTFGQTFTKFTVSGDMTIDGGKINGLYNNNNSTLKYWLNLEVIGDLSIGSSGSINLLQQGFKGGGPGRLSPPDGKTDRAAYGGTSGAKSDSVDPSTKTYGSILIPYVLGSSGQDYSDDRGGGGAIWIEVVGDTIVNGSIKSDGQGTKWGAGTGGSIYIETLTLSGGGSITANGGYGTDYNPAGGGGRIALYVVDGADKDSVSVQVYGGSSSDNRCKAGAGTIYEQYGDVSGVISVDNRDSSAYSSRRTHIPANLETVTCNGVVVSNDTAEALQDLDLVVSNKGWVEFTKDLELNSFTVDDSSTVYLEGATITIVDSFTTRGTTYSAAGEYLPADLGDGVQDGAVSGGKIVIEAKGTLLIIQ